MTTKPQRIQLRRTKGWRMPEGAIVVARPSKWGNPFVVGSNRTTVFVHDGHHVFDEIARSDDASRLAHALAAQAFHGWLLFSDDARAKWIRTHLDDLAGHDLACWCRPDHACHADTLLELANGRPAAISRLRTMQRAYPEHSAALQPLIDILEWYQAEMGA